jgi:ankyrin repeat protein
MRAHLAGKLAKLAVAVSLVGAIPVARATAAAASVPIIEAAKAGDLGAIQALIAKKADVNAAAPDGTTALHWAADRGDAAAVNVLLKAGANLKVANRYGATPFGLAAAKGHADVILRMLQAGEDAKAVVNGEPVLMQAARAGNPVAVKALLAAGADPNVREPIDGQTALMWAAAAGNTAVARMLVEAGGDLKARANPPGKGIVLDVGFRMPPDNDPLGLRSHRNSGSWGIILDGLQFTPLLWAARGGHAETVKALIDLGADVNEAKPEGTTSLIIAIINNHWELASKLLDWGADPNKGPGYTALHQLAWSRRINLKAAFHPGHPEPTGTVDSLELAKKILAKKVDINARMTESFKDNMRNRFQRIGATAFMLSAKAVDVPMLRLLHENGADRTILTINNDTPLMAAAGIGLSNPGEDVGNETETLASVNYLLELGEDVHAKNKNNETALHGAAYRGFKSVAQVLVDRGAELDVPNLLGWTPLTVADGVFYAGIFKQQPSVAVILRETYTKRGLPVPAKPDTTADASAKAEEKNGTGPNGGIPVVGVDKPAAGDKKPQ